MNLLTIAYKSIRQRALSSSLTALSVALGVTLMVTVLVIHGIFGQMFGQNAVGYDLIIGPKGSRLQLVLNTIYRVSQPIENLPYRFYRELAEDPRVEVAIPMALGDVTQEGGFPIVGTIPEYFTTPYGYEGSREQKFGIQGDLLRQPFDAIIGSVVARQNDWTLGTKLKLVHAGTSDHVHDEEFTVVGVLRQTGTPNDKTVFVSLSGFYMIAGHDKPLKEALARLREFYPSDESLAERLTQLEAAGGQPDAQGHHHELLEEQKEVTAVLIRMRTPVMSLLFQGQMNEGTRAQAVNPIAEMKWIKDNIVGNVGLALMVLTSLIIVVSGVSIFVSIYNSMSDRKREIAIMRALGASRQTVFSIILTESVLLCVCGGLLGLVLGHGLVFVAAPIVEAKSEFLLDPFAFEAVELILLPSLIALASLIGFVPGMTAYRTDVADTLSA